jgi:hypothetical protein
MNRDAATMQIRPIAPRFSVLAGTVLTHVLADVDWNQRQASIVKSKCGPENPTKAK